MPHQKLPLRYGLVLFPAWEVLDVFGPLEALNTISRTSTFSHKDDLSLVILAETLDPVTSGPTDGKPKLFNPQVAQSITPTHTFSDAPDVDVIFVPGGFGTGPEEMIGYDPKVDAVLAYIKKAFPKAQYLFTVCTGSGLAAQAGVLDERAATTNKAVWNLVTPLGANTYWVGHARWVVSSDKKVWTTSGVSAGTDGFLAFLDHVYGNGTDGVPLVDTICTSMEYTRVAHAADDPWAVIHGASDVPPQSWPRESL